MFLLNLILPHRCFWCAQSLTAQQGLCDKCQALLPTLSEQCQQCALPMAASVPRCANCQKQNPAYDSTIGAYLYVHPVKAWIHQFKFSAQFALTRALLPTFIEKLQNHYQGVGQWPSYIIPVPLHAGRLRQRGFNQALLLARALAKALNGKVAHHYCRRIRHTSAQMQLNKGSRSRNLQAAFQIDLPENDIPEYIALVDDVMTTGQTVHALAKAFKAAGVKQVDVWCLARTPRKPRI